MTVDAAWPSSPTSRACALARRAARGRLGYLRSASPRPSSPAARRSASSSPPSCSARSAATRSTCSTSRRPGLHPVDVEKLLAPARRPGRRRQHRHRRRTRHAGRPGQRLGDRHRPGAGDEGGRVVAAGPPEEIARSAESVHGALSAIRAGFAHRGSRSAGSRSAVRTIRDNQKGMMSNPSVLVAPLNPDGSTANPRDPTDRGARRRPFIPIETTSPTARYTPPSSGPARRRRCRARATPLPARSPSSGTPHRSAAAPARPCGSVGGSASTGKNRPHSPSIG